MKCLALTKSITSSLAIVSLLTAAPLCAQATSKNSTISHDRFFALPLTGNGEASSAKVNRYGIPFLETAAHPQPGATTRLPIGSTVKHIFFLGMTESSGVHAWGAPKDYSDRFFVGDDLGAIRLDYADGSAQVFPLILGESVWWGKPFYQYPAPFPTDAHLRSALALSLHLYPVAPVEDGNYVAAIVPRMAPIVSIEIENSTFMKGGVNVAGVTVEAAETVSIPGATSLPASTPSPAFAAFMREKPLRESGADQCEARQQLSNLSRALYSSSELYKRMVVAKLPSGYTGPRVSFHGSIYASILENAFYANVQDMLDKIDPDGMYHTSTKGAVSWGGAGFGTYRPDVGIYYRDSWSRDLGRSLQELTELGYLGPATHTADYSLRMARLWADNPSLKYHGESLPPHWSRVINKPDFAQPFENDGHGLIALFVYELWRRLPDRDAWLRSHWADVKAAGDWIPWQFDHPEISGAADGVLLSTGESAGGKGNSVYPDAICMTALEGLAQMADSIGETSSAALWRETAGKMRKAISAQYITTDPKYGRVWTQDHAGWPNRSTVLGPLIFTADYKGFAPSEIYPAWKSVDEATYQRLIDTFYPFGFYGWAMGYGQGFITQSALLLDRMRDATTMLDWTAKEIYDPRFGSFVVPEGVQIDPAGRYWYSTGDLGNGVQEAEIVKVLRIMIGVDDNQPRQLRIFPRMPYGWTEMEVDKYPALVESQGRTEIALIHYDLKRTASGMSLQLSSDRVLGPVDVRLGPFKTQPQASDVLVNGRHVVKPSIEKGGDSWWIAFNLTLDTVSRSPVNSSRN
jgi:hypothetical protein